VEAYRFWVQKVKGKGHTVIVSNFLASPLHICGTDNRITMPNTGHKQKFGHVLTVILVPDFQINQVIAIAKNIPTVNQAVQYDSLT